MERIVVQLDEGSLNELDEAAREASLSRSAVARQAIETALAERRRKIELQQVRDSFARQPQERQVVPPKAAQRRAWPG
ncbi:MAG: CopG family ribbon-helix-helix protein [Actinomycetota bacterium]